MVVVLCLLVDFMFFSILLSRLIDARDIIFECSPDCECQETCAYRLSQNLKFHLEIFQTSRRGWGVRSKDYIAQGDFVCEYVGELRNCNAALPNPYTLEIDCEQRIKGHRGKVYLISNIFL